MRVCLITLDYSPYRSSGLAVYAEDLANGLVDAGHAVTVVASQRPGVPPRQRAGRVEVQRVAPGPLDWISFAPAATRWLSRQDGYDILHFLDVHFAYAWQRRFVASVWQSFRQRLTADGGRPPASGSLDRVRRAAYYRIARALMERPSLARAERLIAACRSTREEFIRHYGVSPERIDEGIQGIDTDVFRPVETGALRARLGLEGCRLLLFAGFITPRKGSEHLARSLPLLPHDVHLLIMGRWARGCRDRFYAEAGPAAARVHELGYVADEERPACYSLADLYVSPSMLEGLGITPIEAQACGTPAIVTSASSGPEEVGEAGVTVPPGDAPALAEAIRELLADEPRRRSLGQLGRARVVANFSHRRMARLTLDMYTRAYGQEWQPHADRAD